MPAIGPAPPVCGSGDPGPELGSSRRVPSSASLPLPNMHRASMAARAGVLVRGNRDMTGTPLGGFIPGGQKPQWKNGDMGEA